MSTVLYDWHLIAHVQLRTATSTRSTELPQRVVGKLMESTSCGVDGCDDLQPCSLAETRSAQLSVIDLKIQAPHSLQKSFQNIQYVHLSTLEQSAINGIFQESIFLKMT